MVQKTAGTKPAPTTKRRRIVRSLINLFAGACVLYIALLVYLYFHQRELIFPGSAARSGRVVTLPRHSQLLTLSTPQGNASALFCAALLPNGEPDPNAARRPTLLYSYGNGGSIIDSQNQIQHFRQLDLNVMTPDYLGFGMSQGQASESGCYAAAEAAYQSLLTRHDIDSSKIVFVGWSLGTAVAIDMASKHSSAALITFSAFTSMAEMGNSQYPIVPLPIIKVILKHRFLSEEKIRRVHCPILLVHSHADTLIPYTMADRLAKAAGGPVTRLAVDDSDHKDLFRIDGPKIYPVVDKFIRQNVH